MKRGIGAIAVGVVAAVYFTSFLRYGAFGEDEGLLLMQVARTFRGELPYVDFHTGYPPATFYLNALLFRVFGESLVPVRVLLVLVNATSVALLFALAQPLAGGVLAATVALGWAAYLPLFSGHFASFNIPYPAWYAICAVLAAQLALDRHLTTGRMRPLVAAGVAGGAAFAFKQNSGALAILSCGLVLAMLRAGDRDADRLSARALIVLGAGFLVAGFTSSAMLLESCITIGPTIAVLALRLVWARGTTPSSGRLWPAIACVAAGAILPSLPWLVAFLPVLGLAGLGHEIFLLGTDFDLVYGSPYPLPLGIPEIWPVVFTAGLAGAAWLGGATSRRRLGRERAVTVAVVAGAAMLSALWWASRMPEGVARAIVLQVQHVGFYAAPSLVVAAGVTWMRRLRADRVLGVDERRVLGALVFATCLFALLYPRIDTTHLTLAMPWALVLGAWATNRVVRRWAAMLGVPVRVSIAAAAATAAGVALAAAGPNFVGLVSLADGRIAARPQVALASARVPIHVETERGEDLRAMNALFEYLRAHVQPDEPIFAFPSLALVPFALDLRTATPHDYFFAGRPDHLEEAVIVRRLRDASPRWVLTLNRRLYFFYNAPAYYFMLRDFLRERYTLAARFGRYDVLRRRDLPGDVVRRDDFGPPAPEDRTLALLADVDAEWRRAGARNVIGGLDSAEAVATRAASFAPTEAARLLVVRGLGGIADPRAIPFLWDTFHDSGVRLRNEAAGALTYVALGTVDHAHIIAGSTDDASAFVAPVLAGLDPAKLRAVLADEDARARLGVFALWAVTERGDTAAKPELETVVREETSRPFLQASASYGLARLGFRDHLCALVPMLGVHKHELQDTIPSLLLALPPDYADVLTDCLARGLAQPTRLGREVTAWVAGAAKLPAVGPALETALDDPEWRVRIASSWALGMLRYEPARAPLAARANDADPTVRDFAREALARLDGAPW